MEPIVEPDEDFGEEISRNAIKSWAGSQYMTSVVYQDISLTCLPQVACDAVSAKYAIRMQKFIDIRSRNGTQPTRGGGRRGMSISASAALPHPVEPHAVALPFSPQNLYDCVPRRKLTMDIDRCLDYVMEMSIHTLENYPFTDYRYQCECKSDFILARKITIDGWQSFNADKLVERLDKEPIIARTGYTSIQTFFYYDPDRVVGVVDVSGFSPSGLAARDWIRS